VIVNKKIVSFSGFARSGKGTFAEIFQKELVDIFPNLKCQEFSFAYELRRELDPFLIENFGISAFEQDTDKKEIIRPLLIAYGNAKRKKSGNQYWIQKLHKNIENSDCDIAILSDLRFAEDEKDELGWLKTNKGLNFHIRRYNLMQHRKTCEEVKRFNKAPNEFEKENEPKLIAGSNQILEIINYKELTDFRNEVTKICQELIYGNIKHFG
jgi:hypothetical protein